MTAGGASLAQRGGRQAGRLRAGRGVRPAARRPRRRGRASSGTSSASADVVAPAADLAAVGEPRACTRRRARTQRAAARPPAASSGRAATASRRGAAPPPAPAPRGRRRRGSAAGAPASSTPASSRASAARSTRDREADAGDVPVEARQQPVVAAAGGQRQPDAGRVGLEDEAGVVVEVLDRPKSNARCVAEPGVLHQVVDARRGGRPRPPCRALRASLRAWPEDLARRRSARGCAAAPLSAPSPRRRCRRCSRRSG